jgi:hypothetical protein
MKIQVAVFDSAYWGSPAYIQRVTDAKIGDAIVSIRDGRFAASRESLKKQVASDLAAKTAALSIAVNALPAIQGAADDAIDSAYGTAQAKFEQAFEKISRRNENEYDPGNNRLSREATELYGEGVHAISGVGQSLGRDLGSQFQVAGAQQQALAELQQRLGAESSQAVMSLVSQENSLLDDPRAASVVYAPGSAWRQIYNDTLCEGYWGNTDCAVKMEYPGSFTIKGVRNDAAKITQATFTVGAEAVKTVAALYGIQTPTPGTNGNASKAVSPSPMMRRQNSDLALQQLNLAQLTILDGILAQRAAVAKTQADRNRAIANIQAVFASQKSMLAGGQAATY